MASMAPCKCEPETGELEWWSGAVRCVDCGGVVPDEDSE